MKTKLLTLLITIFSIMVGSAQTTISLGTLTGSGSTNVLLSTSTTINRYSRTISIYSANEIAAAGGTAGLITSLAWDKSGPGEYTTNDAYIKIYLKHVTDSIWPSVPAWPTEIVGATEVFTSTTYSIPTGTGWKSVPFTTPFNYNGTGHLAIFVEWDRSSTPTGAINWGRSTTTAANATRVGSSTLASLVLSINASRPLVQLVINSSTPTPITSLSVNTLNNVPAVIVTDGDSIQMEASILPISANQAVNWSIVPGTGAAIISSTGMVTALSNGTVWAKAVSVQDATFADSVQIAISNQIVPITSLQVNIQGGLPPTITTLAGTLNFNATILPANADQSVVWSVSPVNFASISSGGLLTAATNGTVWVKATSVQDPTFEDSIQIIITAQNTATSVIPENTDILLFPNPVFNGVLNFEIRENAFSPNTLITILDLSGQIVYKEQFNTNKNSIQLPNLAAGIYLFKVTDKTREVILKFNVD